MNEEIKKCYKFLKLKTNSTLEDLKSRVEELSNSENKEIINYAAAIIEDDMIKRSKNEKDFFNFNLSLNNILTLIIVLGITIVFNFLIFAYLI